VLRLGGERGEKSKKEKLRVECKAALRRRKERGGIRSGEDEREAIQVYLRVGCARTSCSRTSSTGTAPPAGIASPPAGIVAPRPLAFLAPWPPGFVVPSQPERPLRSVYRSRAKADAARTKPARSAPE
jgi:hypothetical protein